MASIEFVDYNDNVVSLNPAFVEIDTPETRSLLDRARGGDAVAFGEICRAYEMRLLRQAMGLCGDEATAEELAEDTLVEAWKYLRRYNGRCQFFTWLCSILLNRWRNGLRKKRPAPFAALAGREREEVQERIANVADDRPAPDQEIEAREQAVLIRQCIETLPAKQQQVVYLRFYVDDSIAGIAAALNCSVGTVKSRLFNALDKLRGMNAFTDVKTKTMKL